MTSQCENPITFTEVMICNKEELETLRFKLKSLLEDITKEILDDKATESILKSAFSYSRKITDVNINYYEMEEGLSSDELSISFSIDFPTIDFIDISNNKKDS